MKIAMLYGPQDLRIEEHELNTHNLSPTEIHVRTEISALKIGTDRGNYEGAEKVPGAPDYPRQVGDSNLGVVEAVGSEVSRFQVGDRVVSRVWHQSEYVADENSKWQIVKVPDTVDSEDAVWSQLYTLSAHCYRKAWFTPGETVAVIGLGILGMGAVALGPCFGARVIGLGNSPIRMDMARKMGAHVCFPSDDSALADKISEFTNGIGVDLVILTANPWPAVRTSMEVVRTNGRVAIVSLPGRGEPPLDHNPLDMERFYFKGISLIAVSEQTGYLFPTRDDRFNWLTACTHTLSLMEDGRLTPQDTITHRLTYDEMNAAYEKIFTRDKDMLGVIFDWRDA